MLKCSNEKESEREKSDHSLVPRTATVEHIITCYLRTAFTAAANNCILMKKPTPSSCLKDAGAGLRARGDEWVWGTRAPVLDADARTLPSLSLRSSPSADRDATFFRRPFKRLFSLLPFHWCQAEDFLAQCTTASMLI